jgi:hypothetical protein
LYTCAISLQIFYVHTKVKGGAAEKEKEKDQFDTDSDTEGDGAAPPPKSIIDYLDSLTVLIAFN